MPSTFSPVLKAGDLRLIHACSRIAVIRLKRTAQQREHISTDFMKAVEAVNQLHSIIQNEMTKHNIVPAMSAQELRDENLTDAEIPTF